MLAALALHVAVALLAPRQRDDPVETQTIAQRVTVALQTPRPTPKPTREPTPHPLVTPRPRATLAPEIAVRAPAPKAAATPHLRSGGAAAHRAPVPVKRPIHPAPPVSLAEGSHAGKQNGGAGTGAAAGTGDSGLSGAGTGSAHAGNGNGGDMNAAPCGDIFLLPGPIGYRKDGTVLQGVLAKIILRDGTVDVDRFPYPFVYPAAKANPFREDAPPLSADGGIPVQEPPPGSDVTRFPVTVQIVLKYTDPKTGLTSLPACNPAASAP